MTQEQLHYLINLLTVQYENVRDGFMPPEAMTRLQELAFIDDLRKTLEAMSAR
jgi:hypothetical protein